MKTNFYLWLALVTITFTAYFSSEDFFTGRLLALTLVVLTGIKFLGIGFQFLELKKAHKFWKTAFVFILTFYIIFVVAAYR